MASRSSTSAPEKWPNSDLEEFQTWLTNVKNKDPELFRLARRSASKVVDTKMWLKEYNALLALPKGLGSVCISDGDDLELNRWLWKGSQVLSASNSEGLAGVNDTSDLQQWLSNYPEGEAPDHVGSFSGLSQSDIPSWLSKSTSLANDVMVEKPDHQCERDDASEAACDDAATFHSPAKEMMTMMMCPMFSNSSKEQVDASGNVKMWLSNVGPRRAEEEGSLDKWLSRDFIRQCSNASSHQESSKARVQKEVIDNFLHLPRVKSATPPDSTTTSSQAPLIDDVSFLEDDSSSISVISDFPDLNMISP